MLGHNIPWSASAHVDCPFICFPALKDYASYLVMRDQLEVCPLSCRAMFQLVSGPLQSGIRFLQPPLPTPPTASLAVDLPMRAAEWAYPVPLSQQDGEGFLSTPAILWSACVHHRLDAPDRLAFALSLSASLAGLYSRRLREFTSVNHATRALPAPASMLAGVTSASRLGLGLAAPVVVLDASHPAVTSDARSSRLLLAEQQVSSDYYRQDSCDSDLQVAPVWIYSIGDAQRVYHRSGEKRGTECCRLVSKAPEATANCR